MATRKRYPKEFSQRPTFLSLKSAIVQESALHVKKRIFSERWPAIRSFSEEWIPADDDEISFHRQDAQHSNESPWKPKQVPLAEDRILVLDVG